MSYENFITKLLNVKPSEVLSVSTSSKKDGTIIFKVRLKIKDSCCPICNILSKTHGYYKRELTHSTLVNRKCIIVYEQRRFKCPECCSTFSERTPFIDSSEKITYETKINVLNDLKQTESTYTSVTKKYNLSATKVTRIFDKHVNIERKPLPMVLSIDEHYFPNYDYGAKYCCLFMDFQTGIMIDVLHDRKKNCLVDYFSDIKNKSLDIKTLKSELDNVKYISIDMYDTYRDIAHIFFPDAKVCADSFHVLKHLTDAFNKLRVRLLRNTEDQILKYLLVKFRNVFDRNKKIDNEPRYNKRLNKYVNLRNIRNILFDAFSELKIAYELKEYYIRLNAKTTLDEAPNSIDEAIEYFKGCGIDDYEEFYKLLKNWREEIVNSFTLINGRRINNSYMESKNRVVSRLIFNANGFKNFKRTRNRILYCLNTNDTFKI